MTDGHGDRRGANGVAPRRGYLSGEAREDRCALWVDGTSPADVYHMEWRDPDFAGKGPGVTAAVPPRSHRRCGFLTTPAHAFLWTRRHPSWRERKGGRGGLRPGTPGVEALPVGQGDAAGALRPPFGDMRGLSEGLSILGPAGPPRGTR